MFNINPSNDSYLLALFESISPINRAFPKSFSILHYTLNDTLCYDRMLLFSILASDGHLMVVLVFHFLSLMIIMHGLNHLLILTPKNFLSSGVQFVFGIKHDWEKAIN